MYKNVIEDSCSGILNNDVTVVLFQILAESSVCDEPESRVVGVHHLPDHMALCLAISSGDILLWNANLKNVIILICYSIDSWVMSVAQSLPQQILTNSARHLVTSTATWMKFCGLIKS